MNSTTGVSPAASGAQFGAQIVTPPPSFPSDKGASFGNQNAGTFAHPAPLAQANYGLSRYLAWNTNAGESQGGQNIGSFRNLNGPEQYQPVEVR
jgi:hypothetical protein